MSQAKDVSVNPACSGMFSIHPAFHTRIRKMVRDGSNEFGGDSIVDFREGIVYPSSTQSGTFNSVDLKRGLVDWHTHPATCRKVDQCTIGLPSPSDLVNVLKGASIGTMCHLLYSREGTYVIQVREDVRQGLLKMGRVSPSTCSDTTARFHALFKQHNSSKAMSDAQYDKLSREYISLASRIGIRMSLHRGDSIPRFTLKYNCSFTKAGPGLNATTE